MEAASVPAEGAGTETTEGEPGAEQAQPGFDPNPLMERLDELSGRVGELHEHIQQQPPGQESPEEETYEPPLGADDLYDETGAIDPQAAQQYLEHMAEAKVAEKAAPLMQAIEDMRIERDAEALETQYPELRDAETAKKVLTDAKQRAARIVGQEFAEDLARRPGFIELVYGAGKGFERAAQETPAGGSAGAELEAAGGTGPAQPEQDPGERIVQARNRHPFWNA